MLVEMFTFNFSSYIGIKLVSCKVKKIIATTDTDQSVDNTDSSNLFLKG